MQGETPIIYFLIPGKTFASQINFGWEPRNDIHFHTYFGISSSASQLIFMWDKMELSQSKSNGLVMSLKEGKTNIWNDEFRRCTQIGIEDMISVD